MCQKDDSDMLPKLEIKRIESISRETQTDRQFRKTVSRHIYRGSQCVLMKAIFTRNTMTQFYQYDSKTISYFDVYLR